MWANLFSQLLYICDRTVPATLNKNRYRNAGACTDPVPILDKDRCGRMPPKMSQVAGTYQQGPVKDTAGQYGKLLIWNADKINLGPKRPRLYSDKIGSRLNSPLTDCNKRGTEYRLNYSTEFLRSDCGEWLFCLSVMSERMSIAQARVNVCMKSFCEKQISRERLWSPRNDDVSI
jgi:hypothetical protein